MQTTKQIYVHDTEIATWKWFKKWCVSNNISMSAQIAKFIKELKEANELFPIAIRLNKLQEKEIRDIAIKLKEQSKEKDT